MTPTGPCSTTKNYDITPKPHGEEEPDWHHMTGTQNPDFSSLLSSDLLFVLLRFGIWLAFAVAVAGQKLLLMIGLAGWLVVTKEAAWVGLGGGGGGCSGGKRKCVLSDGTSFGQGKKTVILRGSLSENLSQNWRLAHALIMSHPVTRYVWLHASNT